MAHFVRSGRGETEHRNGTPARRGRLLIMRHKPGNIRPFALPAERREEQSEPVAYRLSVKWKGPLSREASTDALLTLQRIVLDMPDVLACVIDTHQDDDRGHRAVMKIQLSDRTAADAYAPKILEYV